MGKKIPPRGAFDVARPVPGYLGPYRLLNVVHTGHASLIWQAYDDANQRIVGVKTLLEQDTKDREQVHFLRWEAAVGQKLRHANIIEIYNSPWDLYQPYFAMEWFSSPNLKQRMLHSLEKMLPLVPKIIDQACLGLSYLHQAGWIHRDIKPDNFLVADDATVKLIDFALAKRARRGLSGWFGLKNKIVQGTKSYISPEQIRGQALDGRADLYSLACTIQEILSGKPPFTGTSANDLLNKHLRSSPPSLEALNSNITTEFAQLIKRSLAKNRDARPESVDDFLREFRMMRVFKLAPAANLCKRPGSGTEKG
jgi:eukaryotic-like serine/threonine-protein kinase